jgi:hypothetical protein
MTTEHDVTGDWLVVLSLTANRHSASQPAKLFYLFI